MNTKQDIQTSLIIQISLLALGCVLFAPLVAHGDDFNNLNMGEEEQGPGSAVVNGGEGEGEYALTAHFEYNFMESLYVNYNTQVGAGVTFSGDAALQDDLLVWGALDIGSTLVVDDLTTLDGGLELHGDSTCDGDFTVSGVLQGVEIKTSVGEGEGEGEGDLTVGDDADIGDKLAVGTGTSGETCKLHVKDGSASPPSWIAGADQVVVEDNDYAIQQLCTSSTGQTWLQFSDNTRLRGGIGYVFDVGDDHHEELRIITGGSIRLKIDDDGEIVHTGTLPEVTDGEQLGVSTSEATLGRIGIVDPSSKRYKENVRDVEDGDTTYIYSLRPVMFDYKDPAEGINQCGLIAEEVELVAAQLVDYRMEVTYPEPGPGQMPEDIEPIVTKTNEPEVVHYSRLIVPILVEIKKLRARNDALKQQIAELEAR